MKLFQAVGILFVFLSLIAIAIYLHKSSSTLAPQVQSVCQQAGQTEDCMDTSKWSVLKNTVFHYLIFYPTWANIQNQNNDGATDFTKESEVDFGLPPDGAMSILGWDIWSPQAIPPSSISVQEKKQIEAHNKIGQLSLKSFAETIRNFQITNLNPNFRRQVGEMRQINFAGQKAYEFTLTGSFISDAEGSEYSLEGEYIFFITQNLYGKKMIIYYRNNSNPIVFKMIQSFKFE